VVVLNVGVYGIRSLVSLGVYRWIMLGGGMTILLLIYVVTNVIVEVGWKIIVLRVLPLPVFFIKVIGG